MGSEKSDKYIFSAAVLEVRAAVLRICDILNFSISHEHKLTIPSRKSFNLWKVLTQTPTQRT